MLSKCWQRIMSLVTPGSPDLWLLEMQKKHLERSSFVEYTEPQSYWWKDCSIFQTIHLSSWAPLLMHLVIYRAGVGSKSLLMSRDSIWWWYDPITSVHHNSIPGEINPHALFCLAFVHLSFQYFTLLKREKIWLVTCIYEECQFICAELPTFPPWIHCYVWNSGVNL